MLGARHLYQGMSAMCLMPVLQHSNRKFIVQTGTLFTALLDVSQCATCGYTTSSQLKLCGFQANSASRRTVQEPQWRPCGPTGD